MEERIEQFRTELDSVREDPYSHQLMHRHGQIVSPLWHLNRFYQLESLLKQMWEKQKLFQIQESQIHEKVTEILVKHLENLQYNQEVMFSAHEMKLGLKDGPPTTEKVTTDSPSDVATLRERDEWGESITPQTPPSSPSGLQDTQSGPVGPSLECVHIWRTRGDWIFFEPGPPESPWSIQLHCEKCDVLKLFAVTPVPDVHHGPSTSVSQESQPSDAPTSVGSPFTLVTCPTCQGKGTSKDGKSVCSQCLGSTLIRRY